MLLENTTDENIYVFAGIFVPGRGSISVDAVSAAAVQASPLIADYIAAGALVFNKTTPVVEAVVDTKSTLSVKTDKAA